MEQTSFQDSQNPSKNSKDTLEESVTNVESDSYLSQIHVDGLEQLFTTLFESTSPITVKIENVTSNTTLQKVESQTL